MDGNRFVVYRHRGNIEPKAIGILPFSADHSNHIDEIKEQDLRLVIVEIEVRTNEPHEIDAMETMR